MTSPQQQATEAELAALLQRMQTKTSHGRRSDLTERLTGAAARLADSSIRVVVVGQFKQGKSSLVNALVAAAVCPVDDIVATSVPTIVSYGEHVSAALVTELAAEQRTIRTPIDPARLREHVTDRASEAGFLGSLHAEVTLPRPLLKRGIVFVDTPGVGRAEARASTNLTLLPEADAVIMVTDSTQELTSPELAFLKQAASLCPRLACVVSKSDLQHQWRGIVEADSQHLAEAGLSLPILVTSALMHELAHQEGHADLRDESGIDSLADHLLDTVGADVIAERHRSVADEISAVGDLLAMVAQSELDVLGDPASGGAVVIDLQHAEANAERLTRQSSRWQNTLSDGIESLISDIEFDLRDRLRDVGREAEQLIDSSDPGKAWEETGSWLADAVTQAVSDNFVWAHERSVHLAEVVGRHFALDGKVMMPELSLSGTDQALRAVHGLEYVDSGRLSLGQKFMIGLKGSYGGVLMFGLMTTLAGMALVNPFSIAAGVVMGGFAYRQDASQRLEQRRSAAKVAVRKLTDEAIFKVSKESRDRMSRIRRLLRDHFIGVAENFKASITESIRVAKRGAEMPTTERGRRADQVAEELRSIREICARAAALTAASQTPAFEGRTS